MKTNDAVKKILGEPICNMSQSLYDSFIKANASFRSKAGMKTTIVRITSGHCCEWCNNLAGTYNYQNDVPDDIYRRHDRCKCTVTYKCGKVTQNIWSKKRNDDIINERKQIGQNDQNIKSADRAKNIEQLKKYFKDNYGFDIDQDVWNLDFESVREGLKGIDDILTEFTQAKESLTGIGVKSEGIMCTSYDGSINFNNFYYNTRERAVTANTSVNHFHPDNTNVASTGAHEAGHLLEKALIDKNYDESGTIAGRLDWNDGTQAKNIVSQACKNAKKVDMGKGLKNIDLKRQISGYALQDNSECMAEAVSDYYTNRDGAQLLSKEIWKLLKEELK